jgi:release factor glutamine methyltransferase
MINSAKAIDEMRAIGLSEADIRDLFTYRYSIDYDSTLTGRLYVMPDRCDRDLEVLGAGYPVAYVLGFVNFCHLKINVDPHVLIPRPETEELMGIIEKRQAHSLINNALDLCTGSGCIALALKKMYPHCEIYASDYSPKAIMVAQKNADENKLEINLALSNWLEYFTSHQMKFDLIVCNPPYIKNTEILDASLSYEPQDALFGGEDGLNAYFNIFSHLDEVLSPHGVAYFELEASNYLETLNLAKDILKAFSFEIIKDLEGKERFMRITRNF